jgi:hypothetical protein
MGTRIQPTRVQAMGEIEAVNEVIDLVARIKVSGALNIYDEDDCIACGDETGEATERKLALRHYLTSHWSAQAILVGEAPGKDGARWSGVPFTSQRQLTGLGPVEPSATTVHRVLSDLHSAQDVLLWNASVLFPPNNRDPRRAEVDACAHLLKLVCRGRTTYAIGRYAQIATGAPYIRHPSHGGASLFAEGLRIALRSPPGVDVRQALDELIASRSDRVVRADRVRGATT